MCPGIYHILETLWKYSAGNGIISKYYNTQNSVLRYIIHCLYKFYNIFRQR
jgi:hypothetical protein